MRLEIDTPEKVRQWLQNPLPAVFQGQNLLSFSDALVAKRLHGCAFLGCKMTETLAVSAAKAGCLIIPCIDGLFDAFRPVLYRPHDLYDKFDPADPFASYEKCFDKVIYNSYKRDGNILDVDVEVIIARRLHDASVAEALDDVLNLERRKKTVAIMGGHDIGRDLRIYRDVASLCQQLAVKRYTIITGGGPGLMEAANLGAYTAGFEDRANILDQALAMLKEAPKYNDRHWLATGYRAWKAMGTPDRPDISESFSIPTWFYGHEPPNVFATQIAKYFENSVREDGLLAVALAGVVFAEGNGGTVQEIFQDACQNYYRTQDATQSPMILLGKDYWAPAAMDIHNPDDKRKDVYSLLRKLAIEKGFSELLLLTDDISEIVKFLEEKSPL